MHLKRQSSFALARLVAALALFTTTAHGSGRSVLTDQIAEAPTATAISVSPDGHWVAFSAAMPDLAKNLSVTIWQLQALDVDGKAKGQVWSFPDNVNSIRWCANSRCIGLIRSNLNSAGPSHAQFEILDIATKQFQSPIIRSNECPGDEPSAFDPSGDFAFSPNGQYVAFGQDFSSNGGQLDPRKGIHFEDWNTSLKSDHTALCIADLRKGTIKRISPPTLSVSDEHAFAWAPSGRELAVSVDKTPNLGFDSDIAVIDLNGKVRALVERPGRDTDPVWSPDGKRIAFLTDNGKPSYLYDTRVGIVTADGRSSYLATSDGDPDAASIVALESRWTAHSVYVELCYAASPCSDRLDQ